MAPDGSPAHDVTRTDQQQHTATTAGQLEDDWSQSFANACVGLLKYDKGDIKRLGLVMNGSKR